MQLTFTFEDTLGVSKMSAIDAEAAIGDKVISNGHPEEENNGIIAKETIENPSVDPKIASNDANDNVKENGVDKTNKCETQDVLEDQIKVSKDKEFISNGNEVSEVANGTSLVENSTDNVMDEVDKAVIAEAPNIDLGSDVSMKEMDCETIKEVTDIKDYDPVDMPVETDTINEEMKDASNEMTEKLMDIDDQNKADDHTETVVEDVIAIESDKNGLIDELTKPELEDNRQEENIKSVECSESVISVVKDEDKTLINNAKPNVLDDISETSSENTNNIEKNIDTLDDKYNASSPKLKEDSVTDVSESETTTDKIAEPLIDEEKSNKSQNDVTEQNNDVVIVTQNNETEIKNIVNSNDTEQETDQVIETIDDAKSCSNDGFKLKELLATDEVESSSSPKPMNDNIAEVIDSDEEKEVENKNTETLEVSNSENIGNDSLESEKNKQERRSLCGLSNTLDILSDDEEDEIKKDIPEPELTNNKCIDLDENTSEATADTDKGKSEETPKTDDKCINLDDDDDVMLVDEETPKKDEKVEEATEIKVVEKESEDKVPEIVDEKVDSPKAEVISDGEKDTQPATEKPEPEIETKEKTEPSILDKKIENFKPLVPDNFLKKFKTNIADMTREELEEFCLLTIVEGVIERSNLSDIAAKLKAMAQNVEEWKKKVMMLTKQNRDLQIVVSTVKEEQRKRAEGIVTPLKIMRSVGMQVVMTESLTDKMSNKRKSLPNPAAAATPSPQNPKTRNSQYALRGTKPQNNTNNKIPVPRLVPASNSSPMKAVKQTQSPVASKTPPQGQKVEKRPFSKVQSVTVDLTDDEPAPKQLATSTRLGQNVRLVSQLMAPRAQINQDFPRKVYIPINAQKNNVRPPAIVIKPGATRGRGGSVAGSMVRMSQAPVRLGRAPGQTRHPAPLPEAPKQPQLSNWKALPPEPDLKISKVENGIVISWKIEGYQEDSYEEIASYQLYAYQETASPPSTALWKKIGDVKALPLPMACTLTQFMAGFKYYFAVRAVDIRSRVGPFSLPGSILLLNK